MELVFRETLLVATIGGAVSVPTFSVDIVREGLCCLLEGPVQDEAHPLHDPVIWLVEASCWVFDDSGLSGVLDSAAAVELLGRRLYDDLAELRRSLDEAQRGIREDLVRARAKLTAPVNAVLADLAASD